MKARAEAGGPVVRLADVADVLASSPGDVQSIGSMELFPAPPPGRTRNLAAREVQDVLLLRGVNLVEHRITGASQVELSTPGVTTSSYEAAASVPGATERTAEQRASEAIAMHLRTVAGNEPWQVDLQLTSAQSRELADAGYRAVASGGAHPWVGRQQFVIACDTPAGARQWTVAAHVTLPASVVVAVKSLPRGTIVQAHDVMLQRGVESRTAGEPIGRLEDAIGRETARAISAGQPLDCESLQMPILVRRGEAVTIYARAAGLRVRTTVRAREDGGLGDLVAVESMETRERFYARVCGVQEVEVFAQPLEAETRPAGNSALQAASMQGGQQ